VTDHPQRSVGKDEEQEFSFFFSVVRGKKTQRHYLSAEQFMRFLNDEQRDSRLNEILYPPCDLKKARALIEQYEYDPEMAHEGKLSHA